MITIDNFTHRLGNQLFQIAAAYQLAKDNGVPFYLPKRWDYAKYFNFNFELLDLTVHPVPEYIWKENGFHYTPISFMDNMALHGYFQSEKYFKRETVREIFKLNLIPDELIRFENICAAHVRRGDYVNLPDHHPLCTIEYYWQAMNCIKSQTGIAHFFIYSDDIKWCEESFDNENFNEFTITYCKGFTDIHDFHEMSLCAHNIISNSTFSWWAAMLNKNPDKIVVSPHKDNWHGLAYAKWNHDDIIPEDWHQIKF